jgi:DNA-binding MarR family transcriptional regulator
MVMSSSNYWFRISKCFGSANYIADGDVVKRGNYRAGTTTKGTGGAGHSAARLRLMQLPRNARGMHRGNDFAASHAITLLRPHDGAGTAARRTTRGRTPAARLDLTLPTVSGLITELDRAGFVIRLLDETDHRDTVVRFTADKEADIHASLDQAAAPIRACPRKTGPAERRAFAQAMSLLETELRRRRHNAPATVSGCSLHDEVSRALSPLDPARISSRPNSSAGMFGIRSAPWVNSEAGALAHHGRIGERDAAPRSRRGQR